MGSLSLSHCLSLCGVQIKKWGGQEVEESGLIIPIWSSRQIPNSAGRQLSWFCQVTVISHSQRQLDQDCSETGFVYSVHILLAAVKSLIDRPDVFCPPSVEMFPVNHS